MNELKIKYQKSSRTISVVYSIKDREEDLTTSLYIFEIAIKNKLIYNTYEDDFNHRVHILSGINADIVETAYKQLEKLK